MKHFYISSATLLLLLPVSMASLAADPKAAPEPMQGMHMQQGMGMSEAQLDTHLRQKQDHQLKMHDLSNQILAEQDPAKKENLKNQQLELMKAHHAQKMAHHQEMKKMHHPKMMQPESKTQ